MDVKELTLKGLLLVTPSLFKDGRGLFLESYRHSLFKTLGIDCSFVQDNHSVSERGCVRGMHYQSSPGQAKLIRVAHGKIFDVAVDIRPDSPTFGSWEGVYLDDKSHQQLFVPVGFAHGFCVVSETATVLYKVSADYNVATERGFRWNDSTVGIQWPVDEPTLSERDQTSPDFCELFDHAK